MTPSIEDTRAQFIEFTRIVRTAVILDHMYEFMEEVVPLMHPLWNLWAMYSEQNTEALVMLEGAIATDTAPDWLGSQPGLSAMDEKGR